MATTSHSAPAENRTLFVVLLTLTFGTGLIDAISFLGLGHVFTANMTGNVVFMAFALTGAPELSLALSCTSLLAFMAGAIVGGRLNVHLEPSGRLAHLNVSLLLEAGLLATATVIAQFSPSQTIHKTYILIILTACAMGIRNAVVRKLAVPDLTTTVLTLTVTALAAESIFAGGKNSRWPTRMAAIGTMFAGAFAGAFLLRFGPLVPFALSAALPVLGYVLLRFEKAAT